MNLTAADRGPVGCGFELAWRNVGVARTIELRTGSFQIAEVLDGLYPEQAGTPPKNARRSIRSGEN